MKHNLSYGLAESGASRTVSLLSNKQIELRWDQVILSMRMADLLVLNKELRTWMEAVDREWVELYRLSLNDCVLFIRGDDVYRFCALVQEATEQLPRRTVRWADLTVQLAPYTADQVTGVGCFSCN